MTKRSWFLALALAPAAWLLVGPAGAATIRDQAGMFSDAAVRAARSELDRVERETRLPVTVETVESLDGRPIGQVLRNHARQTGAVGLYVLLARDDHKIEVVASDRYTGAFGSSRTTAVRDAFLGPLKQRDFDAALAQGVRVIGEEAQQARGEIAAAAQGAAARPVRGAPAGAPRAGGGFGIGTLLFLGLIIFGAMFVFRMLGSMFGAGRGYTMGPGGRPMYGPGGYGYGGGGGGGFLSSVFGGIGGALAGNWLYDQMSGRHHHNVGSMDSTGYGSSDAGTQGDDWSGSGSVGDWGGGGGDAGGDWGGGGGGGDWGGGGGDGAGGDW